jgi:hypothetical protein
MSLLRMAVKDALWRLPLRAYDARRNHRCTTDERILIVQNAVKQRAITRDFLHWLECHLPELRARLEFCLLPFEVRDWSRYLLVAFWGGDTLLDQAPWLYQDAITLTRGCRVHGLRLINPASHWSHASKSQAAKLIAATGIRTARMHPISDVPAFIANRAGLALPLLVREDHGHQQRSVLVHRDDQLRQVPWNRFRHPIAVEFIDTRSRGDNLFRKYRYIAVGGTGIAKHLMFDRHWEVKSERVMTDQTKAEETAFVNAPDPNHAALQAARRAIGLDVVGFDYAYDREGRLVVWEANPFPDTNLPTVPWSRHIFPAVERTYSALARLYLRRANLPVPGFLDDLLATVPCDDAADAPRRFAA